MTAETVFPHRPARAAAARTAPPPPGSVKGRERDVRIDFWRGIAMFIIFVAHFPGNLWTLWIPARFGLSDAAEWFVFCSGFASAIAFGAVFAKRGWLLGAARVAFRVWQVWWSHICLFLAVLVAVYLGSQWGTTGKDYVGGLNLYPFVENPAQGLVHLMTLTYVPNYFDILPMYLIILMMIPLVMGLAKIHSYLGMGFVALIWGATQVLGLELGTPPEGETQQVLSLGGFVMELPAEWWSERPWFFNPFGWCLVFFSGYAISIGWVKPPKPRREYLIAAVVFVALLVPFSYYRIYNAEGMEWIKQIRADHSALIAKTDFGLFRWLHFMALAYIGYHITYGRNAFLLQPVFRPIVKVGQQSLAVFISSMVLARIAGMLLDELQAAGWSTEIAIIPLNLGGFAILIAIAYSAGWFKTQPWRRRDHQQLSTGQSATG